MNHCGTVRLETERLVLRPYRIEDAHAVFINWSSDPEVTKFLTWSTVRNEVEARTAVAGWCMLYARKDYYNWAITMKGDESIPIGTISVVYLNPLARIAEVGYCIGRAWWHQGITSEALKEVIDFLFDVVDVNRIEAWHDPRNVNSGKVMEKCGMKYEATLHSADWNNLGICDANVYYLLKSER